MSTEEFGISAEPPFTLDDYFRTVLGTIQYENFAASGLFLTARKASSDPTLTPVFDPQLEIVARSLLSTLLMLGFAGTSQGGLVAAGRQRRDWTQVVVTEPIPPCKRLFGWARNPEIDLVAAIRAARNLEAVKCDRLNFARFKRGMRAWWAGCQAEHGAERLHQFVRAVDALLRLKRGEGMKEFARRIQIFARLGDQGVGDLEEVYRLRSAEEHMNDFDDVLSFPERERVAGLRVFQIEAIAHSAYSTILGNRDLLQNFIDDISIDGFWQQDDLQRRRTWGPPIDLPRKEADCFEWH